MVEFLNFGLYTLGCKYVICDRIVPLERFWQYITDYMLERSLTVAVSVTDLLPEKKISRDMCYSIMKNNLPIQF